MQASALTFLQGFRPRGYTIGMDRVRFGRALGVGTRAAAKSLLSAAEAAAAPDPRARPAGTPQTAPPTPQPVVRPSAAPRTIPEPAAVKAQARNLGRSVWSPFARFSSVLWLEVTGTFFAIFALIAGEAAWKVRAAPRLAPGSPEARHAYLYLVIFALFAYFAVSSFVRARKRSRK